MEKLRPDSVGRMAVNFKKFLELQNTHDIAEIQERGRIAFDFNNAFETLLVEVHLTPIQALGLIYLQLEQDRQDEIGRQNRRMMGDLRQIGKNLPKYEPILNMEERHERI